VCVCMCVCVRERISNVCKRRQQVRYGLQHVLHRVLQHRHPMDRLSVAVCWSVRQYAVVYCRVLVRTSVCWSMLECAGVCYIVLLCTAVRCSVLQCAAAYVLQCASVYYRVLQCTAVCCSILQCIAACCSVLQRAIHQKLFTLQPAYSAKRQTYQAIPNKPLPTHTYRERERERQQHVLRKMCGAKDDRREIYAMHNMQKTHAMDEMREMNATSAMQQTEVCRK